MMALKVIKLGGSVLAASGKPDVRAIRDFAALVMRAAGNGKNRVLVVVGGGGPSRNYVEAARSLKASEAYSDVIGIELTRINARLLISALGENAYSEPPRDLRETAQALSSGKIVVTGGTVPGHTTDCVAATLAEYFGAECLVICKDVKGVYDSDPRKDPKAKFLEKVSAKDLVSIVAKGEASARSSNVTDLLAAKIIKRSAIRTFIVSGRDLKNIESLLSGKKWVGTVVTH